MPQSHTVAPVLPPALDTWLPCSPWPRCLGPTHLLGLSGAARSPHELHDGYEDGDEEAADKHHKDAPNVLHAQAWGGVGGGGRKAALDT